MKTKLFLDQIIILILIEKAVNTAYIIHILKDLI